MGKYFLLQLKRGAKQFPFCICVVLALFLCASLVFSVFATQKNEEPEIKPILGMVGTAGDQYMQWGLAALQFDSSMLSIKIKQMNENQAEEALKKGDISAYIIFPENFAEDAFTGSVPSIRFVSTAAANGLLSILKVEIIKIVEKILVACESGAFGVGDALDDADLEALWSTHVNGISVEYVDYVFDRSKFYGTETLVAEEGIPFETYMLGGITVLLIMLSCLTFAPVYIYKDNSLHRVLHSRRVSVAKQVICEIGVLCIMITALSVLSVFILCKAGIIPKQAIDTGFVLLLLVSILMISALIYLAFSLCSNIFGGVMGTFLCIFALCFTGGCIYPIYFFPKSMQKTAEFLPTYLVRDGLTKSIAGYNSDGIWWILCYGILFVMISIAVRYIKVRKTAG